MRDQKGHTLNLEIKVMANILKERVNIQNYINKLKKWSEKKNPNGIQQMQKVLYSD